MSRYTKEERKEDIPSYYIFIYGNITCTTTLKLKLSFFSQDQDSSEILMMRFQSELTCTMTNKGNMGVVSI